MNCYTVTRDGVTVTTTETLLQAYRAILARVPYSVHHAFTHEGWEIVAPDGRSMREEYTGGRP